ncbi:helix-turn-helix transcriptional regulator [Corynebacterium glutamicum]|uniref:helix-turn-helix transcriptional regulator n=1 Tax=Corynebacterium glutamicum TaxID=1718 RepID=UPI001B8C80B3|nr:DNA-binding protein [Corynebacterium glutamicum]
MSDQPLTIEDMVDRYPGTNRQTWSQHRFRGTGPAYIKVGKRIFYRPSDVLAWEESLRRVRTDDVPAGVA